MQNQYGRRPSLSGVDTGARKVAPSYGKESFLTYGRKSNGLLVVEQDAERLTSHMLGLDPCVVSYQTQPFVVDLVGNAVLKTAEQHQEARARHKGTKGPIFYTPDFLVRLSGGIQRAVEVKLDGYLGDEAYQQKLQRVQAILLEHGYEFTRVVIPISPKHPLRLNIPLLHQANLRKDLMPQPDVVGAVERLARQGAKTVADFCAGLSVSASMVPILLAFGALRMDLVAHQIRGDAPAEPAYGALDHLQMVWSLDS